MTTGLQVATGGSYMGESSPFVWKNGRAVPFEELQRNRAVLDAMSRRQLESAAPQTVGEGIGRLGESLVSAFGRAKLDREEREGREAYSQAFAQLGDDPTRDQLMAAAPNGYENPAQSAVWQALMQRVYAAPDWQVRDVGGDLVRWDNADPKSQPGLFYDGPDAAAGGGYGDTVMLGRDADGNPVPLRAAPGGGLAQAKLPPGVSWDPGDLYQERAAGTKIGAGEGQRTLDAPTAAVNVDQLNSRTDHVLDVIDKAIGQVAWDSAGIVGQTMGTFGGTKAYDLRKTAQTIKSNLGFAELQAMRDASPTGGALGQVAVQELEALQSTLESLDPNQSEDQLKANLGSIKTLLERQKMYRQKTYDAKYGPFDGQSGSIPTIGDAAAYANLPSGSQYRAPDGTVRTKP